MRIPTGLTPPQDVWDDLRYISRTAACFSVLGSLIVVFQLLTSKLLVTNRQLLIATCVAIFVSHLFIAIGCPWPDFCVAEGVIVTLFGLAIIVYTGFIAFNTYRSLVLFRPTGNEVFIYHAIAWSIPTALVIAVGVNDHSGFVLDWSGWCSINSHSLGHVFFLSICLAIVLFDCVMCVLVIRKVHASFSNTTHLARKERNTMESRLVVLILVTFGIPLVFHAAIYIEEFFAPKDPVIALYYLDAAFTYSCGLWILIAIIVNPAARKELVRHLIRYMSCGIWVVEDEEGWDDGEYERIE